MFAKVFRQIFESSIAEDYSLRHIFMDLLVLADLDGVIDKTHEAISRITNVPLDQIQRAITQLESPDLNSRNDEEEGRRIVRLDDHRDWGWQIVNYEIYRKMRDEEARRAYFRENKRQYRAKIKLSQSVTACPTLSNGVLDSPHLSTHVEEEGEAEDRRKKQKKGAASPPQPLLDDLLSELKPIYPWVDTKVEKAKIQGWFIANPGKRKLTRRFVVNWFNRIDKTLEPGVTFEPATKAEPFITREKIEDYVERKHWSHKLVAIASGKLKGDKYYGEPIRDEVEFQDAMAAIYEDWTP